MGQTFTAGFVVTAAALVACSDGRAPVGPDLALPVGQASFSTTQNGGTCVSVNGMSGDCGVGYEADGLRLQPFVFSKAYAGISWHTASGVYEIYDGCDGGILTSGSVDAQSASGPGDLHANGPWEPYSYADVELHVWGSFTYIPDDGDLGKSVDTHYNASFCP